MKKIALITKLLIIVTTAVFAQNLDSELKTISVQGFSRKVIYPKKFIVQLYLEEDTYRDREGKIIQDTLERIDSTLIQKLNELNFTAKRLDLQSMRSTLVMHGKERKVREGKIYEFETENKEEVLLLFRELRFEGLEGIEVVNHYEGLQETENALYEEALNDAKEKAKILLKGLGYKIDDVIEIEIEVEPQNFLRAYPYNGHSWYNSNQPKFKFDNQPSLLRCVISAKFSYK